MLMQKREAMSRTPALSQLPPLQGSERLLPEGTAPRLADEAEAPVDSPVHALQRELARLQPVVDGGDSQRRKASGWVRLGLPLVLSIGLWFVIIQIIGTLWQ